MPVTLHLKRVCVEGEGSWWHIDIDIKKKIK